MSNIAINNLPAADLPLQGTEIVPLVQSGVTVQTAVSNVPAAAASAGSLTGTTLAPNVVNSSLTSVGTIGTGTWQATTIAISYGGTGATTASDARTALGLTIGSNVEAWDADLDAIAALSSTGFAVRTATNTWAQRTIAQGGGVTVTNGNGVSGNPSIAANYNNIASNINLEQLQDVFISGNTNGDILYFSGGSWHASLNGNAAAGVGILPNAADGSTDFGFKVAGSNTNIDFTLIPQGSGNLKLGNAGSFAANGTATITVSNLGPAGIATATIKKWITVKDNSGTVLYIPAWGA